MKTLVAYFSATGTTKNLAERLSNLKKADLFEIVPKERYTEKDLDWRNNNSRSSIEMNNLKSRPEILNKVKDMNSYDIIYLGFPIWRYRAPTIINSFLESYDLNNKRIIPFATSGGSKIGKTNHYLKDSCEGAILVNGKVYSIKTSDEELKNI